MVNYSLQLDAIFGSLSDPTRRDILKQVAKRELSVSDIAKAYDMTLAAISKHLGVLEKAKLILKHRRGKQQYVQLAPAALKDAAKELENYQVMWNKRLDRLEEYLKRNP